MRVDNIAENQIRRSKRPLILSSLWQLNSPKQKEKHSFLVLAHTQGTKVLWFCSQTILFVKIDFKLIYVKFYSVCFG